MAKNAHKVTITKGEQTAEILPESLPVWEGLNWKLAAPTKSGDDKELVQAAKDASEANESAKTAAKESTKA